MSSLASSKNNVCICDAVDAAFCLMYWQIAPDTTAAAMEVPDFSANPPVISAVMTSTPGAATSTSGPQLLEEPEAHATTLSYASDAPTPITEFKPTGDNVSAATPELPAAATTTNPALCNSVILPSSN